jgi:hypothetical protein
MSIRWHKATIHTRLHTVETLSLLRSCVPLLSVANPRRPVRSPAAQERDAIALLQMAFRRTRLSAGKSLDQRCHKIANQGAQIQNATSKSEPESSLYVINLVSL